MIYRMRGCKIHLKNPKKSQICPRRAHPFFGQSLDLQSSFFGGGDGSCPIFFGGGGMEVILESVSVHPVYGNPRTGLLRTFWEPDWVLRSPFRGLCVQGALNCPTKRAFLCTLYTETPERAFQEPSGNQTGFLEARSGVCVFRVPQLPFDYPFQNGDWLFPPCFLQDVGLKKRWVPNASFRS